MFGRWTKVRRESDPHESQNPTTAEEEEEEAAFSDADNGAESAVSALSEVSSDDENITVGSKTKASTGLRRRRRNAPGQSSTGATTTNAPIASTATSTAIPQGTFDFNLSLTNLDEEVAGEADNQAIREGASGVDQSRAAASRSRVMSSAAAQPVRSMSSRRAPREHMATIHEEEPMSTLSGVRREASASSGVFAVGQDLGGVGSFSTDNLNNVNTDGGNGSNIGETSEANGGRSSNNASASASAGGGGSGGFRPGKVSKTLSPIELDRAVNLAIQAGRTHDMVTRLLYLAVAILAIAGAFMFRLKFSTPYTNESFATEGYTFVYYKSHYDDVDTAFQAIFLVLFVVTIAFRDDFPFNLSILMGAFFFTGVIFGTVIQRSAYTEIDENFACMTDE